MSFLELQNITKIYPNGTKAVNETSLNIENGEFVVFVGPSGCGKSTLLRMIAGLEDVTSGEIVLMSIIVAPFFKPSINPFVPRITSLTSSESETIVIAISDFLAADAGES